MSRWKGLPMFDLFLWGWKAVEIPASSLSATMPSTRCWNALSPAWCRSRLRLQSSYDSSDPSLHLTWRCSAHRYGSFRQLNLLKFWGPKFFKHFLDMMRIVSNSKGTLKTWVRCGHHAILELSISAYMPPCQFLDCIYFVLNPLTPCSTSKTWSVVRFTHIKSLSTCIESWQTWIGIEALGRCLQTKGLNSWRSFLEPLLVIFLNVSRVFYNLGWSVIYTFPRPCDRRGHSHCWLRFPSCS